MHCDLLLILCIITHIYTLMESIIYIQIKASVFMTHDMHDTACTCITINLSNGTLHIMDPRLGLG